MATNGLLFGRFKPSVPYNDRGVKASPSSQTAGRAELNLLANLLGVAVEETEVKVETAVTLIAQRIYFEPEFLTTQYLEKLALISERVPHRVSIDAKATRKSMQQQMADLGFDDEDEDSSLTGGAAQQSGNSKRE